MASYETITKFTKNWRKSITFSQLLANLSFIEQSIKEVASSITSAAETQSSTLNKICKSNYEIANSILTSSTTLESGLKHISDAIERNNKREEFYKLKEDILKFENTLIQLGNIKEAYEKMSLKEFSILEISDADIHFFLSIFDETELEKLLNICSAQSISPMQKLEDVIHSKSNTDILFSVKLKSSNKNGISFELLITIPNLFDMRIPSYTQVGLTSTDNRFNNNTICPILNYPSDCSKLICIINDHIYDCHYPDTTLDNYVLSSSFYQLASSFQRNLCKKIKEEKENEVMLKNQNENRKNITEIDSILSHDRINVSSKLMESLFNNHPESKFCISNVSSDDIRTILGNIKEDLKTDSPSLDKLSKIVEFQAYISSLNRDICLENLRNLHEQLWLQVRNYSLMSHLD